jgi:hypothetical protein
MLQVFKRPLSSSFYPLAQLIAYYSKTSLMRTNWVRTLVQISESRICRSTTGIMFRETIKWNPRVSLGNKTLF